MERKLVVFSKPDDSVPRCQKCIATKRWLNDRNIEADILDVSQATHLEALKEHSELAKYLEAPVLAIVENGEVVDHWSGFNPTKLEEYQRSLAA